MAIVTVHKTTGNVVVEADVQIGAVELKDHDTNVRSDIKLVTDVAETDNALCVQAPVLGVTTGAAVDTDANGTLQQYLRGLVKLFGTSGAAGAVLKDIADRLISAGLVSNANLLAALNTVAGATADAKIDTDAAGTLSSKLRGAVSRLAELVATTGATTGAAVTTDANGTVQQYLRGLVTGFAAKIPVLGQATMLASSPVVIASDQSAIAVNASAGTNLNTSLLALETTQTAMSAKLPATLGRKDAAESLSAALSTEDAAKVPSLGSAAAAAATPVTIATDDPQFGAVGAAADVAGIVHGQLRYIGEAVDDLAVYGRTDETNSVPVALSTEDAAKVPSLGQALMAASSPVVIASDQSEVKVQAGTNLNTSALALDTSVTTMSGKLPATLGRKDAAASLSTTLSTEDAAKVPSLGQAAMVASSPVVLASDQSAIPVTASAGTNLNTSALALETGGNLAGVKTNTDKIPAVGQAAMAASTPVAIASDQSTVPAAVVSDYIDGTATCVVITIADANSTQSAELAAGRWHVTSNIDIHITTSNNPTATTNSHPVWGTKGDKVGIIVAATNDKIAAIRGGADNGKVWLSLAKG